MIKELGMPAAEAVKGEIKVFKSNAHHLQLKKKKYFIQSHLEYNRINIKQSSIRHVDMKWKNTLMIWSISIIFLNCIFGIHENDQRVKAFKQTAVTFSIFTFW